jgi:hypothetical protein
MMSEVDFTKPLADVERDDVVVEYMGPVEHEQSHIVKVIDPSGGVAYRVVAPDGRALSMRQNGIKNRDLYLLVSNTGFEWEWIVNHYKGKTVNPKATWEEVIEVSKRNLSTRFKYHLIKV